MEKEVKSLKDEKAKEMAKDCPEGKSAYHHVIGRLGAKAVKEKYKNWPEKEEDKILEG